MSRDGFTLLELLLVVFILTIILGMTLPRIRSVRTGVLIEEAARLLGAGLDRARLVAVNQRAVVAVSHRPENVNRIELRKIAEQEWNVAEPVAQAINPDDLEHVDGYPLFQVFTLPGELEIEKLTDAVIFFPDGSSSGERFILSDHKQNSRFEVLVNRVTGAVTVRQAVDKTEIPLVPATTSGGAQS